MLVGACIVVVSAVVLYLISVCSMKEKTFEEVIAEQRQRNLQESQQAVKSKSEKERIKKRFRKGKGGTKADESPKQTAVAVSVEEERKRRNSKTEKMVELELEPEIIQPVEETKAEKPKKKKEKPAKAILHNKEEKAMIQKTEVSETFHTERGATVVKDELELKHEREKILKKAEEMERERAPQEKERKEKKRKEKEQKEQKFVEAEVMVQETMVQQEQELVQAQAPPTRKSKKAKEAEPGELQTIRRFS